MKHRLGMRRALTSLVCAVMLIGVLPSLTPPAIMAVAGNVISDVTAAYVGDAVIWRTFGALFEGTNQLQVISVYHETVSVFTGQFPHLLPVIVAYQPAASGRYYARQVVMDSWQGDSVFSAPVYISLRPGPKNVKAAALSGTVLNVTWNVVPGATGYEIWRATAAAGPYALVKTTNATSWSNTYLTPGKSYYYKVRSTNAITFNPPNSSVVSGAFNAPVCGVPLAKAAIASATATGKDRVKLVITPVAGASGYRIFTCATAGGTYKLLKTTTSSTLTITGLKPNTQYYFKAEAYKRIYTTSYLGPMSAYKGVKTLK